MRYPIFLIVFALLSGCATPAVSPWTDLTTDTTPATTSLDCGSFPLPDVATKEDMAYSKAGANALDAYRVCSEANEGIVDQHAAQIAQLKIARKGLTEAGLAQRRISDMKQEILEQERRHNLYTSVGYWVVILGMGLAL